MISNNNIPSLSIVIPCHNEEEVIKSSYDKLLGILKKINSNKISSYQFVMVNNASTDQTLYEMEKIFEKDTNVKILDLRVNFGYQSSITSGLFNADGDIVISIDADLQDDPNKIIDMIEYYHQGYEMVLGVRKNRDSDSFFKKHFANIFYNIINFLGAETVKNHADFRLLSKQLINDLKQYPETNRYLRGLVLKLDSKYKIVEYDRLERKLGESKFKLKDLMSLAFDGITSFSVRPMKLILWLGILMCSFSIIFSIFTIILYYLEAFEVKGWASTIIILLFFGGVQNISLGVIGEYVSRVYLETKRRPLYSIRKIYEH
jgi:polyisoprenyl-phosphate glycosyltransferase